MATGGETQPEQLQRISQNLVYNLATKESVKVETLWADSDAVIVYLRRFGCQFCRLGAVKLSLIQPILARHGVRLIGIGLEFLGAEEFVEKKYLQGGEVFVDEKKQGYQLLEFKRFNWFNVFKALFSATARNALREAREMHIEGNLAGDGLQNGGMLIVRKGGYELLHFHREEVPGDHVPNGKILQYLGIDPNEAEQQTQPSAAKKEEMKEMEEEALNCTNVCSSAGDIVGAIPDDVEIPEMPKKKKFVLKKKQK